MARKVPCKLAAFDTESTTVDGYGVLYSYDLLVADVEPSGITRETVGDVCTHIEGRNVTDMYRLFSSLLEAASEHGFEWRIAIHNITFDIAFFRQWLKDLENDRYTVDVTARSSTKFLSVKIYDGEVLLMVLFDTLAIFRKSLRQIGDDMGFEKLHIDYEARISPDTVLPPENVAYNRRDTEILMVAVCQSLLPRESVDLSSLGTSILTATSLVRKQDRESPVIGCAKTLSKAGNKTTVYGVDRYIVSNRQFDSERMFDRWRSYSDSQGCAEGGCFAGGVNLANTHVIGGTVPVAHCYDLKSAYPGIMLSYKIPCDFREMKHADVDLNEPMTPSPVDVISGRCGFFIADVVFTGLRVREEWAERVGDTSLTMSMALQHKAASVGVRFEAGYLASAERITLTVSTPVFCEISLQYEWRTAEIVSGIRATSFHSPDEYMVRRVLHHYEEKSVAKAVSKGLFTPENVVDWNARGLIPEHEANALLTGNYDRSWLDDMVLNHKGNLNSLYGIMVTNPLKDVYSLNGSGFLEGTPQTFDDYTRLSRNAKMWREAGVCVALYNRYKIVYMAALAVDAGADVLYMDTDSIKCAGADVSNVWDSVHAGIERITADTVSLYAPESVASVKGLGCLDFEGDVSDFCTMGHKKYSFVEDGRHVIRCAGYNLRTLNGFARQLEGDGVFELVPNIVLGFDVRYDSSTGIATMDSHIDDTWVAVDFEADDGYGSNGTHRYRGMTCPGFAILPAGKVMNDTEKSPMNALVFNSMIARDRRLARFARTDVSMNADGVFVYGRRGTVPMMWSGWKDMGDAFSVEKRCE